jgi:DNA-directed RNA polymerase subunit beta'
MAEWDPYTRPIMTDVDGTVEFEDLVDGVSMSRNRRRVTGITKRLVIDWRSTPRGADLRPRW